MKFGYNPLRQRIFLSAYLNWLCHMYKTSRPSLYLYDKAPIWWDSYNERYGGRVTGFYAFTDCDKFCKGIHILTHGLSLDTVMIRLRHEWRHHWQYIYHPHLLRWWHQHESLYKRFHNQAVCAIEMDARNFAIHFQWHPSICDEQLLAAYSEVDLSNLKNPLKVKKLAQHASSICNVMNGSQGRKMAWVPETPAYNNSYRSEWNGVKIIK